MLNHCFKGKNMKAKEWYVSLVLYKYESKEKNAYASSEMKGKQQGGDSKFTIRIQYWIS